MDYLALSIGHFCIFIFLLAGSLVLLGAAIWLVGRILTKCQTLYRIGWILAHWDRTQALLKEHSKDPIEGWRVAEIRDKRPPKGT